MGNSASQVEGDPIMAEEGVKRMSKRKVADDDVNWLGHDLEKALEKRRKLEEDEPYNDAGVRQKAKEIGIEKAMSSSVSEVSKVSQNITPRGLSSVGDESSEFVSADDEGGVAVPEEVRMVAGTEDELKADSSGENEVEEEEERKEETQQVSEATKKPEMIGQMLIDAEEHIARLMKGYSSLPIRSTQDDSHESGEEEEENDDDDDDDDDDDENSSEAQEETQVVQDSIGAVAGAGLETPPIEKDSGHGSMEASEAKVHSDERNVETAPESADESPVSGSQERMSAVEETIRQIKAERSAGGASKPQGGVKMPGEISARPAANGIVPGVDDGGARAQYIAERKAKKKERLALERRQRKASGTQRTATAPVKTLKKPTVVTTPREHKGKTFRPKLRSRAEKRAAKRARREDEMQRAARKDPASYMRMLRHEVGDVPDLAMDADEAA